MTNLVRWLKRFEAGAAVTYQWQVAWQQTRNGPRRLLRAVGQDGAGLPGDPCPLAMQEHLDGFPSMLGRELLDIVAAADDAPQADPALRKELLAMCTVEEI